MLTVLADKSCTSDVHLHVSNLGFFVDNRENESYILNALIALVVKAFTFSEWTRLII